MQYVTEKKQYTNILKIEYSVKSQVECETFWITKQMQSLLDMTTQHI